MPGAADMDDLDSAAPRRARGRRRAVAVAVGLLVPVLLAAAAELALRALGEGPGPPVRLGADGGWRADLFVGDARTGFALAPGYRSSDAHAGSYALGEWPWRGRPAEPAPEGTVRVAVLGDSCVFGVGLETADTLPERLAHRLEARGHGRERVQVLNFGVPGFSTVQIARTLDGVLERHAPRVVVLYPAAWNDQAPAAVSDEEQLRRAARRGLLAGSALARALRGDRGGEGDRTGPTVPRVPGEEVEPRVRAMVERARAAGAAVVVVAPAHPRATEEANPRVAQDREAVRRAAQAAGVPLVDAHELARSGGLADGALFVDFVHPSPELWELVLPALSAEVAAALGEPRTGAPPPDGPRAVRVEPGRAPTLGDVRVTVELAGLAADEPLPVVLVGGAPLLEPTRASDARLSGLLATNRAGPLDVLVQGGRGATVLADALVLEPPTLVPEAGSLVVRARPGDRAQVYLAGARATAPLWSLFGRGELDPSTLVGAPLEVELGPDGSARVALDPSLGARVAQALVTPRGEPLGGQESRLTAAVDLP